MGDHKQRGPEVSYASKGEGLMCAVGGSGPQFLFLAGPGKTPIVLSEGWGETANRPNLDHFWKRGRGGGSRFTTSQPWAPATDQLR